MLLKEKAVLDLKCRNGCSCLWATITVDNDSGTVEPSEPPEVVQQPLYLYHIIEEIAADGFRVEPNRFSNGYLIVSILP